MDARDTMINELLGTMVHVEVDRPLGYRHGDIRYPVNYGYLPGVTSGDGQALGAYILGVSEPVVSFDGRVVGAIRRKNDFQDKLVVAPDGIVFHQGQIAEAVQFQEQGFDSYIVSLLRKSCGVIPYRITAGRREYLIVFEQFSKCWSLPKGHMEAGETETETAFRELFEESGLTARLDTSRSASTEYFISPVIRKQVVYFPGLVSGTPRTREGEIEGFKWVKAEELKNYLFPDTVDACVHLWDE